MKEHGQDSNARIVIWHTSEPTRLAQHEPHLYTYDVPDYYNYGTMGALIGVQLAEIAAVGVKDQRQSEWDELSVKKYTELLQCLLARHKQLGLQNFEPSDADKQQTQLLTLSIGVRLADSALKNVFRMKSKTATVFNDYWPGAMCVFFVRFCLLWCSSSSLTARTRCVLPLYNMEEFAELYGCDAASTGGAVCPT